MQTTETHGGRIGPLHFPLDLRGKYGAFARWRRRHGRLFYLGIVPAAIVIVLIIAGSYVVDRPLRGIMERNLNRRLKGYSAHLASVSFHPLGLGITLKGLTLSQNAHPKPPIMDILALNAGVHWKALLHGALVADFELDRPKMHVNLTQVTTEAHSNVKEHARSWQSALEAVYPLKINKFRIRDADMTYIDNDPQRPLHVAHLYVLAENIRNVTSADRVYPSGIHLQAEVFDSGKLRLDGHANFLQEPFAGFDTDLELTHIELDRVKPVAAHANLQVNKGVLDAQGHVEYAPDVENVRLRDVTIRGVDVEYVHKAQTAAAEEQRIATVEQAAKEAANKPKVLLVADRFKIAQGTVGYIDESQAQPYRIFVSDVDATIKNFSNQAEQGAMGMTVTGKFMGSGDTRIGGTFWPEQKQPNLDMSVAISGTDLSSLSNLFRAYGDFDIAGGRFSLFSEIAIKSGTITGYMKPLFEHMQVTDRRSEEQKSLFHHLYVGLVSGVAGLLENPRGAVATEATIQGPTSNPQTSTWQIVLKLIQNAFFKAILPGFDQSITGSS